MDTETYATDGPLPDVFLTELGRLVSAWSSLENSLYLYLAKLSGFDDLNDETPFILFNHLSFPQRLDIFGALCEKLNPQYSNLNSYKDTIAALKDAQQVRNKYIHNTMIYDGKDVILAKGSARGRLKFEIETVKLDHLKEAVAKIIHALKSLYSLVLKQK